jgi:hypothetical protein
MVFLGGCCWMTRMETLEANSAEASMSPSTPSSGHSLLHTASPLVSAAGAQAFFLVVVVVVSVTTAASDDERRGVVLGVHADKHAEVGGAHALFHGPPPLGEEEELPGGVVEQLDERRGERGDEHHGQGQDGVVLRRGLHGVAPAQLWMAATSTTPLTLSISASTTASRMGMAKKSPAATQPTSAHHFSVSEAAVSSVKSVR